MKIIKSIWKKINYKSWWDDHLVYILLIALSLSTLLGFVLEAMK